MVQLFVRNPNGDSYWTEDATRVCTSFATKVRAALREVEEDGPVDLRDLQTILKSAIDDVILHEMVCRRLSPDSDPRDVGGPLERETGGDAATAEVSRGVEQEVVRDSYQTTKKERVWVGGEWQDW